MDGTEQFNADWERMKKEFRESMERREKESPSLAELVVGFTGFAALAASGIYVICKTGEYVLQNYSPMDVIYQLQNMF